MRHGAGPAPPPCARELKNTPPLLPRLPCPCFAPARQVHSVNGTPINNLADLVAAVEGGGKPSGGGGGRGPPPSRYLRFDLEYNQVVVLDREAAAAVGAEILTQHCIAADRSPDLAGAAGA